MGQTNEARIPRPLRTKGPNKATQNTRQTPQGHSTETTEGPPRTYTATRSSQQRGKQANARRPLCEGTRNKRRRFSSTYGNHC